MGLNIKNPEAHLMAEELSKLTGESMTTAVTIALRDRFDRVRQQQGVGLAVVFWRSARTARYASRSRFVPPIMAKFFMMSADYLDNRRYVRANRYPARRARGCILRACDREQRRPP